MHVGGAFVNHTTRVGDPLAGGHVGTTAAAVNGWLVGVGNVLELTTVVGGAVDAGNPVVEVLRTGLLEAGELKTELSATPRRRKSTAPRIPTMPITRPAIARPFPPSAPLDRLMLLLALSAKITARIEPRPEIHRIDSTNEATANPFVLRCGVTT
jgi:hypothetical protein